MSSLLCAGCRDEIGTRCAHGMMWCAVCFARVQDGDHWQEQYRTVHPKECQEQPGAAAVAYLLHLSHSAGLHPEQSNGRPAQPWYAFKQSIK